MIESVISNIRQSTVSKVSLPPFPICKTTAKKGKLHPIISGVFKELMAA
jgi:hypothetical protein